MQSKAVKIEVVLPNTVKTFEEEEAFFQREYGVGKIDKEADVPADEDCEGIFELEIARGEI